MHRRIRDYFIPHAGNDYRPHSLQTAAVVGLGVMVLLSFSLANLQSMIWTNSDWLVSTVLPAIIVNLTNNERADESLWGLKRSPTLDLAAKQKAEHMAELEYFSHYSPEGVSPWYWFNEVGYHYIHAGENLAVHFTDSGDVVDAWMDSPAHRANIMSGNYTEIGVGTAEGRYQGYRTIYVVQLFGTPEAEAAEVLAVAADGDAEPSASVAGVSDLGDGSVLAESTSVAGPEPTISEESQVLFSDHIATSVPGIPATVQPAKVVAEPKTTVSWFGGLLTSPHSLLQLLYSAMAGFVLGALVLAVFIEFRRQEPAQVAYALVLLALMYGLHQVHVQLSGGAIIL